MDPKYIFSVAQKAIIKKGDKILILKRSPTAHVYPEHWDFPGGKIEHGEKPASALEREVKEETSLIVKVNKPVFTYLEESFAQAIVIIYESKLISGTVTLSGEHTEYAWKTKKEILKMKIEPYLRTYLEEEK
ncbi:MAG: NUDIX domain-containing protein [archaeon]|jgi:8-oxo-dGTP diphosphatase